MTKGGRAPASPAGAANRRLSYEEIRDGFLAEFPQTDEEWLEYHARIGKFVVERWKAMAADHPGGEVDEGTNGRRWDDCTTEELDRIRESTHELVQREVSRQRVRAFRNQFRAKHPPTRTLVRMVVWVWWKAWEHFWGAIGLVAFGLLLLWAFPHLVREVRIRADVLLPAETSPHREGDPADANRAGGQGAAPDKRPAD